MHTHSRHNFGLAFFTPFSDLCVYLAAQFWFDFTGIPCKKGQKSLGSAVDYINLMQRYRMDNFFSLLYLAFGTPDKFGLLLSFENSQ
jgi:hypothetical protein